MRLKNLKIGSLQKKINKKFEGGIITSSLCKMFLFIYLFLAYQNCREGNCG